MFKEKNFEKPREKNTQEIKKESLKVRDSSIEPRSVETKEKYHEEYHTTESELMRHAKYFDLEFEELDWQLHQKALEGLNTMTGEIKTGVVSPQEAPDFSWKQKRKIEKDFLDSLENPEEQKMRKEIREVLIKVFDSLYNSLDKKSFTDRDERIRKAELGRVFTEKGITGKNKEIQDILDSLYHHYGFRNETINNKDEFIEAALIQFDPLIFEEAQRRILGGIKESTYRQSFEDEFLRIKQKEKEKEKKDKEEYLKKTRQELRDVYRRK